MARSACSRGRTVRGVLHEWGRLGGGIFDGSNDEGCHRIQPAHDRHDRRHDPRRHRGVRRVQLQREHHPRQHLRASRDRRRGPDRSPLCRPREVVYPQLFNGELGVVPEYSGTAVVALGGEATSDTAKTHDALVDLMKPKDVAVLDSAPAEDRNAIAITLDTATSLNVQTMSDLAKAAFSHARSAG